MKRDFFAPIRLRTDGSVYFARPRDLTHRLGMITAFFILSIFFAIIAVLALAGPSKAEVEWPETTNVGEGVGGPEFATGDPASDRFIWPAEIVNENSPSIFPVEGRLSSNFGFRQNPFGRLSSEFHAGQDFAAQTGTTVVATADGKVIFSGWKRGYGNIVIIRHDDDVSTRYAHLSETSVIADESVESGHRIGKVGSTGRSTGPHLHYEVRLNDVPADPAHYLPKQ